MRRDDRTYLQHENKNIFPGDIYRQVILEPHFHHACQQLLQGMMELHQAHALMLAEEGIVSREQIKLILKALLQLKDVNWEYDPHFEDLFFVMENRLASMVGANVAGQLHTGRSRNDIDATLFRMVLREKILSLADQLIDFRRLLVQIALENLETVILGYTHTQPAQPTTLAHYLTAAIDFLARDFERLREYYARLNLSPMGAGALTTTSFPINRESVASYLGFDGILENSYDCIASSDYLVEAGGILTIMMTSLSRLLHDFLLYVMQEFNLVQLSDAYVQTSSIMPQKRNPVSLEHSRALANAVLGESQVVMTMLTNTPFGDVVDKEQELQQHLWHSLERATELYRLLTVVFAGMEFNCQLFFKRARESFASVTQLAERIVQYTDISFRLAHQVVSRVVKVVFAEGKSVDEISAILVNQIGLEVTGKNLGLTEEMIRESLDPQRFVLLRDRPGGPAPEEVKCQLFSRKTQLKADESWIVDKWEHIQKNQELLQTKIEELLGDKNFIF